MYSREKLIISARPINGRYQRFLRYRHIATADAMLAAVCPDGNDPSFAFSPISTRPSISSYGLVRFTRGLRIQLFRSSEPTRAMAEQTAARLVFLKQRNTTVSRIQKIPASPKNVMFGKILSRKLLRI